jgi:hypothetical protein
MATGIGESEKLMKSLRNLVFQNADPRRKELSANRNEILIFNRKDAEAQS